MPQYLCPTTHWQHADIVQRLDLCIFPVETVFIVEAICAIHFSYFFMIFTIFRLRCHGHPVLPLSQNQWSTNLKETFNKFKLQVNNLLVEGPFLKLDEKQKVAMLPNWLGGKVYDMFANDLTFAYPGHREKLDKDIKAFDVNFKCTSGMIHTWYQLGSLYSNNCKFQSNFMSKLCKLSNEWGFTHPKEIIKFMFLTHNTHMRVQE